MQLLWLVSLSALLTSVCAVTSGTIGYPPNQFFVVDSGTSPPSVIIGSTPELWDNTPCQQIVHDSTGLCLRGDAHDSNVELVNCDCNDSLQHFSFAWTPTLVVVSDMVRCVVIKTATNRAAMSNICNYSQNMVNQQFLVNFEKIPRQVEPFFVTSSKKLSYGGHEYVHLGIGLFTAPVAQAVPRSLPLVITSTGENKRITSWLKNIYGSDASNFWASTQPDYYPSYKTPMIWMGARKSAPGNHTWFWNAGTAMNKVFTIGQNAASSRNSMSPPLLGTIFSGYQDWALDQPDNLAPSFENCMGFNWFEGGWWDVPCDMEMNVVLEFGMNCIEWENMNPGKCPNGEAVPDGTKRVFCGTPNDNLQWNITFVDPDCIAKCCGSSSAIPNIKVVSDSGNEHVYEIVVGNGMQSYEEALADVVRRNGPDSGPARTKAQGYLATITSPQERNFLVNWIQSKFFDLSMHTDEREVSPDVFAKNPGIQMWLASTKPRYNPADAIHDTRWTWNDGPEQTVIWCAGTYNSAGNGYGDVSFFGGSNLFKQNHPNNAAFPSEVDANWMEYQDCMSLDVNEVDATSVSTGLNDKQCFSEPAFTLIEYGYTCTAWNAKTAQTLCTASGGLKANANSINCETDDNNLCDCQKCCNSCPTSTCVDGVQNGDETGVDCGGSCPLCSVSNSVSPISSTCVDGTQNGDETGVDCGGSCTSCSVANSVSAAGFTTTDVFVIILVVGIFTAISVVAFQNLKRTRDRSTAHREMEKELELEANRPSNFEEAGRRQSRSLSRRNSQQSKPTSKDGEMKSVQKTKCPACGFINETVTGKTVRFCSVCAGDMSSVIEAAAATEE